jgi:rod shape-determining protein MreC
LSELLRRFRFALCYFALASLCALGMASREGPAELGFAPRLVLNLTLPLERMVTIPLSELRGVWGDYMALVGVREENERLRGRLARAEEENHQYREAILSSERFQKLSGFRAQREIPMVPANVIHQDLSPWFQSLIIDQGAAAGIRPGMPVITDSGVVGLVSGTTPGASKVLLVVDPQSRVDAYVERTRARGTVRGTSGHQCDFEYVLRDENIEEGDLLLTSGLGTVYPKGLVVGRVASVDRKTSGLFLGAKIVPAVDFTRLEEVFVILEQRQIPADESFSAADEGLWAGAPKTATAELHKQRPAPQAKARPAEAQKPRAATDALKPRPAAEAAKPAAPPAPQAAPLGSPAAPDPAPALPAPSEDPPE